MGVHIGNNKLIIITEQKTMYVPKNVNRNLNHVIDYIIQYNRFLAKHTIKSKIS